jgi:transposase
MAIYTHHRRLKRIELCVETMRVIKELLHRAPDWTRATRRRHGKNATPGGKAERLSDEERQALSVTVGDDGQWLLDRLEQEDATDLRELRAVETLRDVWAVHYERGLGDHMRWTERPTSGGTKLVETPHDPDAYWATKRGQDWVGYKLQVTETDDPDTPHLITDIAITPAAASDMGALDAIRERQQAQDNLPGERFVDSGYVSGENIKDGQTVGENLIGPIRSTITPQSKLPDGFSHADFQIDFALKLVTCPHGQSAPIERSGVQGTQATFRAATCADCRLHARCCTGKKEGRTLRFGPHYQETQAARKRQLTDDFKHKYRSHRGGVEGCLSALVRGQGIRTTRYDGQAKNHLHALFVGAGVNLARSAAWRSGYRPKKYPPRLGLVVGSEGTGAMAAAAVAMMA